MRDRFLIVADPLERLQPEFDLGVCVSAELLRRGHEVDYLDLLASDRDAPPEEYLSDLPVRRITAADRTAERFWELEGETRRGIEEYGIVLHRKDPPVDADYVLFTSKFEAAPPTTVQVNRPPAIHELSEHLLPLRWPEFAAPTTVCTSLQELTEAVRSVDGEAVAKPEGTYCGIGITFLAPDVGEEELVRFWDRWGPKVSVQPFLPAIRDSGDLRILTIDGVVLGSVLRVPREGSRLANLHAGGIARPFDPTPGQLEACRVVADDLRPLGLHLLGLDFIGEDLTEVNITSPTLIVQINEVSGTRADIRLVDELERLRDDPPELRLDDAAGNDGSAAGDRGSR